MATIGIDVTALSSSSSGGIGTSQYRTMGALAALDTPHRFVMYAATPPVIPFSDRPLDLPWELRLGGGLTTKSNIVWMQTGVNRLLAADRVDVFWGPRHLLPLRAKNIATVATIHDFWDRYFPEQQPWLNRTVNAALIERVVRRADELVTPSLATADDLSRFFGVPREQVSIVPWGVDPEEFSASSPERVAAVLAAHDIERPFLLSLDVFNPRKNFSTVLEAVASMLPSAREHLEVIGLGRPRKTATGFDPSARAVALGLGENVRIIQDVPAEDLVALYSGAMALVYPSMYEGFGMPVLEAMSCGCPVIASSSSSLPEVAGTAGVLVHPDDPVALGRAIAALLGDEPERKLMSAAGRERAGEFTWRRTAERMLDCFDRALEKRAGRGR